MPVVCFFRWRDFARLQAEQAVAGVLSQVAVFPRTLYVSSPVLTQLGLCSLFHPKVAQHNRPIDCGPAASHETTAAARTVNILPSSGLLCRNLGMLNVNVQTVTLIAQQSALAHLCVVYHKQRFWQ